jgi:hypothetical protein
VVYAVILALLLGWRLWRRSSTRLTPGKP